ncbi:hypothetical protein KQY30_20810 [Streptomyces sp. GMY02]|uniref:DUF6415 family natural product biosynthesis protein n=1 Tax=Streptomyces sp. GMY02 TaxID=1333528 RepID=UPI001C2CB119|nr:DUF6415 family natural product biosynthesis protein [Streptomyces sp. GMY02]QXE36314.1 hypothetical protein KQY30_20810 [Streptomyces sp. GMY02]
MGGQTSTASAVRAAVDRARAVVHEADTHEELNKLAEELRDYISQMLPIAQNQTDRMWRGSREWYVLTSRLNGISTEAQQPLAASKLAAHVQVRLLALDCEWLFMRYGTDLPTESPTR